MHRLLFEKSLFQSGSARLGGIDEAGRGPLAGPVVAACVAIDPDFQFKNKELKKVRDSKKLSEKIRARLFKILSEENLEIGIGICSHKIIDKMNIFQANFLAMKRAIGALSCPPDLILVDGKFSIPKIKIKQKAIIEGDNKVFLIAAASIIAKVTRDRIMEEFHLKYPAYCFNEHKGYATRKHKELIGEFGPCEIHRKTFHPFSEVINL